MCTLTIAWQVFDDAPIAVAANRDESVDRPSSPPGRYASDPTVIAPRDEAAGGTWIGYNEAGLFVGITNRWVDRPSGRSRGHLVADCLSRSGATEAASYVEGAVEAATYAGFNLVVADRSDAILLEYDGSLSTTTFDPGVHVVVNVGADGSYYEPADRPAIGRAQAATARAVREALEPVDEETADEWLVRAGSVLGDHDYGVCVHGDGYGTRSSSLIRLADRSSGISDRYAFADGPPCRTRFEPVTDLIGGE
ncbi:MAG: NRDE family protein [Halobacteriota archaeon]